MFYPWCGAWPLWQTFRVMPTVYEQAMSYEEQILFIAKSVNDVLQQIDTDNEQLYQYINQQIQSAKDYADLKDADLNGLISDTIINLTNLIKSTDTQNRVWTLSMLEELRQLILDNQPTIWITNPFTGGVDSIKHVIDQIVHFFGKGITAGEYETTKMSAEKYYNLEMTAYEYDFFAKDRIYPDFKHTMFNPWTGTRVPLVDIINKLVTLHKPDAIDAQLYLTTGITAKEYDDMTLDAYEYDFNAKTILAQN